jgi:hypothetical protein
VKRPVCAGLAIAVASLPGAALAQAWKPGEIVLGSPTTIQAGFRRCEVIRGPEANNYFVLNCLQWFLDHNGKKKRYEAVTRVSGDWIKPNDPSFEPDMQFASVRAAAATAARPAPPRAAPVQAAGGPAKAGSYHCVFFINGMLQTVPGFTLIGNGYRHQNGGGGTIRRVGGTIEFVGGPLDGQAGKVGPNTVHLYNDKRTRTVIDCDTKG